MSARKGVVWSFWMLIVAPVGLLMIFLGLALKRL